MPLLAPFTIASTSLAHVQNVAVRVTLSDGVRMAARLFNVFILCFYFIVFFGRMFARAAISHQQLHGLFALARVYYSYR